MKTIIAVAVAALATFATVSPAEARDGCGRGYHRDRHGHCVPNWRNSHRHDRLVVGRYYNGRGYWSGNRYYRHRERRHNRWHYH